MCNLVWNHTRHFKIERARSLKYKNYKISVSSNIYWSDVGFVKKAEPETRLHVILKAWRLTCQCHVSKTPSSVTKEKYVPSQAVKICPSHCMAKQNSPLESSVFVFRLNYVRPSFLAWFWLLTDVFGVEIKRATSVTRWWNGVARRSEGWHAVLELRRKAW